MLEGIDAAVKITILPDASEKGFVVESAVGKLEFGTADALEKLIATRQGLPSELEKLKAAAGSALALDWPKVNEVLAELYSVGNLMLSQVLGRDVDSVPQLQTFFELSLGPLLDMSAIPLVEMMSPRGALLPMIVPVELFPLLTRQQPPKVGSLPDLFAALEGVLGFSTIIARRGRELSREPLVWGSALPVKLFQHTDLVNARAEIHFFTSRKESFDCEGPWPEESAPGWNPAEIVACQIARPENRFNGDARVTPDQVQHFACHCDTLAPNAFDHSFALRSQQAEQVQITLRDLSIERIKIAMGMAPLAQKKPRPLVFFNACGTAVFDPRGVTSFVEFFMNNGNRGFIGTQTPIPDTVAAKFCELFYTSLLRGATVGKALYEARQQLAVRYRNPLGMLYVHYGPPELRIAR